MLVPIDVKDLDADLQSIGFKGQVPNNEGFFLGSLQDQQHSIEEAPLGYYRYHYWINADTCKEHENYIYSGKNCGIILISVRAEKSAYRVLIRSALAWKACLVNVNELHGNAKLSIRSQVIYEALKRFCSTVFPYMTEVIEEEEGEAPISPIDMATIDVSSGSEKEKTSISRNSSLSSFRSNFALNRLQGSFMASQDSISASHLGSFSSLADLAGPLQADENSELDTQRIKLIREELLSKFVKSGSHIKDSKFPIKLLELEKSLIPKSFNIDIVNLSAQDSEAFKVFREALGEEINRKETVNYIKILGEKYQIAEEMNILARSKSDLIPNSPDKCNNTKLKYIQNEFLETERNYLQQLNVLEQVFVDYLKNDSSGKFILKIREFKEIFDGIIEFIPIHAGFLKDLTDNQGITGFSAALAKLVASKQLYQYQGYFTSFEKRMAALQGALNSNPKFAKYHEDCVRKNGNLNKKGLDQFFIAPIQRMPRYSLLLKEVIKYVDDEALQADLKTSFVEVEKTVQFLNTVKHKAEQTEMLFMMQRKINNFPPDFLRADRSFLSKIACFLTDSEGEGGKKVRYTLYLCNDMVLFAKKRSSNSTSSSLITHDFIFAVSIKDIQLSISRGRKGDKHLFNAEIDMEQACFTLNRADIDGSLLGLKKSASGLLNEAAYINNHLRFLPKNQKKFAAFYNEFMEARNQFILSESPAQLLFQRDEGRDMFYHLFNQGDFESWTGRSPVAVLFLEEESDELAFDAYMNYLAEYEAIAIVQARAHKYRYCIRTRDLKFTRHETIDDSQLHLQSLSRFLSNFKRSVLNAHLLHSLYPPHTKSIQQQQRFVLESALIATRTATSAVKGFFSSLVNRAEASLNASNQSEKLNRGTSQKAGSSPLSSPSKRAAAVEDIRKEIQLSTEISHLHL